jgi:TIR domain
MSEEPNDLKDIFLSYNKADKKWVHDLAARIESETLDGTPDSRKLRVFLDEWDMDVGDNIINKMNEGLKVSHFFAVVMSPEFFGSGWTNFEWTHVISQDPTNAKRRIIPIFLREASLDGKRRIEFPAPFNVLKYLDFREKKAFTTFYQRLIRRIRGLPPERGGQRTPLAAATSENTEEIDATRAEPDQVSELLLSNLLPVKDAPKQIWSGKTTLTEPGDVKRILPDADCFILRGGRLHTFAQLTDNLCPLRKVIEADSPIACESIADWLNDKDKGNWFIALLNQLLAEYLASRRVQRESKGRFFFLPTEDGKSRAEAVGGDEPRMVAAQKPAADGASFWVHHAARMKFVRLGHRILLQLEPTYLFTSDGQQPLAGKSMGRMVVMWGGRQQNVDVLRNFVFWMRFLARGQKEIHIPAGSGKLVLSAVSGTASMNVGIEADHVRIGALMRTVTDEMDAVASNVVLAHDEEEGGPPDETSQE